MTRLQALGLVLTALLMMNCATLFRGDTQQISVNSNVESADVAIDGVIVGRTPFAGNVSKGDGKMLTVSKAGYQTKTVPMNTSIETLFWGNIIFGGLLGSTTDAATGSMYKYAPNAFVVDLVAGDGESTPAATDAATAAEPEQKEDDSNKPVCLVFRGFQIRSVADCEKIHPLNRKNCEAQALKKCK
jgi:hypothetical protein